MLRKQKILTHSFYQICIQKKNRYEKTFAIKSRLPQPQVPLDLTSFRESFPLVYGILTFLQGLELISNADLNIFLCWLVSIVLGRLGPFLSSLSSSAITDESSESEFSAFSILVSFSLLKLLLATSARKESENKLTRGHKVGPGSVSLRGGGWLYTNNRNQTIRFRCTNSLRYDIWPGTNFTDKAQC